MSLPFNHVTLINLYISSYRVAGVAIFLHANTSVLIDFGIIKIQQIVQERQMLSW